VDARGPDVVRAARSVGARVPAVAASPESEDALGGAERLAFTRDEPVGLDLALMVLSTPGAASKLIRARLGR